MLYAGGVVVTLAAWESPVKAMAGLSGGVQDDECWFQDERSAVATVVLVNRNPSAHEQFSDMDDNEAFELLGLASHRMCKLDQAMRDMQE